MGIFLSRHLQGYLGMLKSALSPSTWHLPPLPRRSGPRPAHRPVDPRNRRPRDLGLRRVQAARRAAAGPLLASVLRAISPPPARRARGLPPWLVLRPDLTQARHHYLMRRLRDARRPGRSPCLVTVQVNPPPRPGSLYTCPPPEPVPDPRDKDVVLKALAQNNKGKRKFDGPLWFEVPAPKRRRQSPGRRPSAFRPVITNGAVRTVVPRPGRLRTRSPEEPPRKRPVVAVQCPACHWIYDSSSPCATTDFAAELPGEPCRPPQDL